MPGFGAVHGICRKKAIDEAIDRCIRENILREFLTKRREEVTKVTQLDYTFDRRIELEREDAREEERVNTERERKAKELAEMEVQRLRAELEQYKRRFSET